MAGEHILTRSLVSVLLVNAIAILSEDRFLARGALPSPGLPWPLSPSFATNIQEYIANMKGIAVGWSNTVSEPAFGASSGGDASIKSKLINLMTSVRTLMRSIYPLYHGSWAMR